MKKEKIILVLNGKIPKKSELNQFIKKNDLVICADGAANNLIDANIIPNIVIGDLDSINHKVKKNKLVKIIKRRNQNLNDFQKALIWMKKEKYSNIDIIGFDGKRIDHTIGNFSIALKEISNFNLTIYTDSGIFHTVKKYKKFKGILNKYISIFSDDEKVKITTTGLEYELKNKTLKTNHSGTLNFANSDNVVLKTEQEILVFISNEFKI